MESPSAPQEASAAPQEGASGIISPDPNAHSSTPPQQYTGLARVRILEKLRRESIRLHTFIDWTSTAVQPSALAKAGFFYFHVSDKVQCVFCLGILGGWGSKDDPLTEHRRHFPRCPLILGDSGNIPITEPGVPEPQTQFSIHLGVDELETYGMGICKMRKPRVTIFKTFQSRLETYDVWPKGLSQTPNQLADAGFYYTGVGDRVICYHCNGGLSQWTPGDDAWEEHAHWYPTCDFMKMTKGIDYIKRIQANYVLKKTNPPEPESKEYTEIVGETINKAIVDLSCKICLNASVDTVTLPCAHLSCCGKCVAEIDKCPICRRRFHGYVHTFLS